MGQNLDGKWDKTWMENWTKLGWKMGQILDGKLNKNLTEKWDKT